MGQIINFEEAKEYLRNKKVHMEQEQSLPEFPSDTEMIEVPRQLFEQMITRLAMYEQAQDSGRFIFKPEQGDILS